MTAPLDLTVRLMRDDDVPAVVQLLQDIFGTWPGVPTSAAPIDHLRWKLGDGRPGHQSHHVAELDGRIIAVQLNLHWHMKVGDRVLVVRRGWDSGVHPDYQGRGVMSIMRPAMHEKFDVVPDMFLGASAHAAIERLYEKEDRRPFAHRWLVFVRPLAVGAALRAFKLRFGRSPRKLAHALRMFVSWLIIEARERLVPMPRQAIAIETVERFDDDIESFCAEASQPFDFLSVRNKELLNWRFADPRAGDFTIRLATKAGRVVGYSVLRVSNGAGHIADLLALPGRPDVVASLARDAVRQLRGRAPAIECWLFENSAYAPVLDSCGFLGRRNRRQLTYEAVGVPVDGIEFLSGKSIKAHLSAGDMDWV